MNGRVEVRAFLGFLTVILCVCSVPVSAAIVSFDMSVIFGDDGGVPTNPSPWLNATFDDGETPGTVTLTVTVLNLVGPEKVGGVYFNLDPVFDQDDLDAMAFSAPSKTGSGDSPWFNDPGISKVIDGYKADGDGYFDILIDFHDDGPSKAFTAGDAVEYTITLASLTANSFDFPSAVSGGQGVYNAAAHLKGLGEFEESAWVTTPEPATICLLGIGGLLLRRKRRV